MLWFELMVLASIGFVMSSFSGQMVSAVVTTGVYIAGHLSNDIYALSTRSKLPAARTLGKVVYYLMPDLERLNYRPQASYGVASEVTKVLGDAAYGTAYAALMIAFAVILFGRRDFK